MNQNTVKSHKPDNKNTTILFVTKSYTEALSYQRNPRCMSPVLANYQCEAMGDYFNIFVITSLIGKIAKSSA